MNALRFIFAAIIIVPVAVVVFAGCIAMWLWITVTDPLNPQNRG